MMNNQTSDIIEFNIETKKNDVKLPVPIAM